MNILMRLSARHLKLNRKRTMITIVGIALSIAMVTAISGFIVSFQDLLFNDAVAREGLWHVRYSGLDQLTAESVAAEPTFSEAEITEDENGVTVSLLFAKLDRGIYDRSEEVCFRHGIGQDQVRYHNNLLIAEGVIPGGYYETLYGLAAILLSLVAIASVMVISNAFSISAGERSRQFGLLKSVGATGKQIRGIVLWEGVILGVCAVPLGLLLGLLVQWIALSAANLILGSMDAVNFMAEFRVVLSPWVLLLAVVVTFVTIFLAAWIPARRASRQSAIDAIRQTAEVRIRPRDVRVSPLTGKLFGFEGLLAAKTMRRNRRRYRTTVTSLVVSIVLFIGVSSFGQMMFKASSMVYEDYGTNMLIQITEIDEAQQNRLAAELSAVEGVTTYPYRDIRASIAVPTEWMTDMGAEMLGETEKNVYLYSLSDSSFEAICKSLRLSPSNLSDPEHPGAILVNTSGTYIRQGRRYNFSPYRSLTGESMTFSLDGTDRTLSVMGEIKDIPTEINLFYTANAVNLLIPESVRVAWQPENTPSMLSMTAMTADPDGYEILAKELLSAELLNTQYFITNYEAMVENSRNIWLLIMIFVYGFIAMLSLISVTNVITTISTGIALRKRELAMLRSMGMTGKDILKSLRYESLIYGIKSLVIGIPLGIAVSILMYFTLGGSMTFEYIWPLDSIVISVVAVLLITLITMSFSANKQRKEKIAEVLTSEIM
ncbi:MAG: ABC transporter permease [Oscillospiraceae bacterium]